MKLSIIIPTYNEAENVENIIEQITNICKEHNISVEIVIVDDNSPDGTSNIVKKIAKTNQRVKLIQREGKLGLGAAYIAGFKYALELNSDLIMTMDADLSHNPKDIPKFVEKIGSGYDLVLGSRYISGGGIGNWGIHRTIMSKGANYLAKYILNLKTNDNTTGYRCYTKRVLQEINLDAIKSNGYSFLMEIMFLCQKNNLKIGETPIYFDVRKHGTSKISKKEIFKALLTIIRLKLS